MIVTFGENFDDYIFATISTNPLHFAQNLAGSDLQK